MLADAVRQRLQNHVVLTDIGKTIDPLIVGVSLVIGREDALDLKFIALLQNIQPERSIEKQVFPVWNWSNYERFHNSNVRN
jgi:hypothetical protein